MHDDEENDAGRTGVNTIALDRLPLDEIDYVALGDWHGLIRADGKAWYSGSHETDRFPKPGQTTGHVACVRVGRGIAPVVEPVATGRTKWLVHAETFSGAEGPATLHDYLGQLTSDAGRGNVLLKLSLTGSLGLGAHADLDAMLRSWQAGLLDLRLDREVGIEPTQEEIDALVSNPDDPLIAHVAADFVRQITGDGDDAAIASTALSLLHGFATAGGGR